MLHFSISVASNQFQLLVVVDYTRQWSGVGYISRDYGIPPKNGIYRHNVALITLLQVLCTVL